VKGAVCSIALESGSKATAGGSFTKAAGSAGHRILSINNE